MTPNENATKSEAVNELLNYASPKELQENLLKMYLSWCATSNADCVNDRVATTNIFGNLMYFFEGLRKNK